MFSQIEHTLRQLVYIIMRGTGFEKKFVCRYFSDSMQISLTDNFIFFLVSETNVLVKTEFD